MAIHRDMVVDIPEHAYIQRRGGREYVYMYTRFFRTEEGKPSNESVAVGALTDGDDWVMHPNDNYLRIYRVAPPGKQNESACVGYTAVVDSAFEDLGLLEALAAAFGDRDAKRIRTVAAYMAKEGSVLSKIGRFCESERFRDSQEIITSQRASEVFCGVTAEKMRRFYREWVPRAAGDGYVCYDVTSISTWSRMIEEAEYGYNRDHDRLPQLNLGLFHSEDTGYPIYLDKYNGSVNDYTEVRQAYANARAAGLEGRFKLVTDGVFFQREKLSAFVADGITVTCGMPAYLDVSKAYVDAHGAEVKEAENYVGHDGTFALMVEGQEVLGIPGRVLVGWCPKSMMLLNEDLDRKIQSYERNEIPQIKKYSTVKRKKKFTGLFDFEEAEGGGFTFSRNAEKIAEARRRYGYFTIFTTDPDATAEQIVTVYRDKDGVEKQFTELKQYMDARRARVHSQEAFDGKYDVLVVSLILRRWLRNRLGGYMGAKHLTLDDCLDKLSDIEMYIADDEVRLRKAMTKEQRELLELCGVDPAKLEQRERASIIEAEASEGRSRA